MKRDLRLHLDARKRVSLSKLLPSNLDVHTVIARTEGCRIIIEPMVEIPAEEAWLYKNQEAMNAVRKGLKESEAGTTKKLKRDFSKYVGEEI